jgi:hypothetical protein
MAAELFLIKHKFSQEYFSHGHWTFDATEAQAFRSVLIAISVAEQCGLRNLVLEQQSAAAQMHDPAERQRPLVHAPHQPLPTDPKKTAADASVH